MFDIGNALRAGDRNEVAFWEFEVEKMLGAHGAGHTAIGAGMRLKTDLLNRVVRWCSGAARELEEAGTLKSRCVLAMDTGMTSLPEGRDVEPDKPFPNPINVAYGFSSLSAFFVDKFVADGSNAKLCFPAYRFQL